MIYFEKATQRQLFDRFADLLDPHGYLCVGHSESLFQNTDRVEFLGKTIYRRCRRGVELDESTHGINIADATESAAWLRANQSLLGSGASRLRCEALAWGILCDCCGCNDCDGAGLLRLGVYPRSHIGQRNITFVQEYLRTEGLQVLAEDVGDMHPRKIYYLPRLGKIRMQKLRALRNDTILRREKVYMHSLAQQPAHGGIELF